jgi:transcriptional regulator GlxA family with amidase domain
VLRRRASRARPRGAAPRPELEHAGRCLTGGHGTARIAEVAAEVGWSRRHLAARFAAEYGLTPKEAARIMRFERSRTLVQRPGRRSLADIASACGYYDQAHLAREWNAIIGRPPSAWLAGEELPFVQDDDGATG